VYWKQYFNSFHIPLLKLLTIPESCAGVTHDYTPYQARHNIILYNNNSNNNNNNNNIKVIKLTYVVYKKVERVSCIFKSTYQLINNGLYSLTNSVTLALDTFLCVQK